MTAPIIWSGGLGGSGIDTATTAPVITSASIIWYDPTQGNDANTGTNPEQPVKTFAQAVTNASTGSVVAMLDVDNETITGTVTINKSIKVVGVGAGSARTSFTPLSGATAMFNVTADDVSFENCYFKPAQGTVGTAGRITCANKGLEFYSCQFDSGASDGNCVITAAGSDYFRFDGCTFTVTSALSSGTGPIAINCSGTNIGGKIFDTVFDGSTFGFKDAAAVTLVSATRLYIKNVTLVGKADIVGTGVSYNIIGVTTSGASRILIT